jgi:hypothetical protein
VLSDNKKIFKNNMLEVNGYKNYKEMEIVRFSDDFTKKQGMGWRVWGVGST